MESQIRLAVFCLIFLMMLVWEWRRPFRLFPQRKIQRLAVNFGLTIFNNVCIKLFSGGGAYFVADYVSEQNIGLFNVIPVPNYLAIVLGFLLLDIAIYFQHRVFHAIPFLWRLHRIHHTDLGFDASTALRFHVIEILLSMYFKMLLVLVIGATPNTVILFEVVLNACALFNHGNVRIPGIWERVVRVILITPDIHRIHHSSTPVETNSNYGFSVPWWDRLCGTYRPVSETGQNNIEIGLSDERNFSRLNFFRLLRLPFEAIK